MRERIIVQQALDLGHVQIRPHARKLFQQLVKHTFVEVCVHRLPQKHKLSIDYAARIKKHDQHRLHARFLPPQFLWSWRPWPVHFALCRLVVGSYVKHHDSSLSQLWAKMLGHGDAL